MRWPRPTPAIGATKPTCSAGLNPWCTSSSHRTRAVHRLDGERPNDPRGDAAVCRYAVGAGSWPGVVVIHDALGMSRDVRRQADWLASERFLAVVPDLFHSGKRATGLFALIRGWVSLSDLDATRNWLADQHECIGKIGVIGFCMCGGYALALAADHNFTAASVNSGGPTKEVARAWARACPIVGSFGERDRWWGMRKAPDRIEQILATADIERDIKRYPGAGHGFMNDHGPNDQSVVDKLIATLVAARFDEPATRDARKRIVSFFRQHLCGTWAQANVSSGSGSEPNRKRRPVILDGSSRTSWCLTVAVHGSSCARSASLISSSVPRVRATPLTITLQPSATLWSSASKTTLLLIAALTNLVPSAVRNSTVRCWTTKLTGKISGSPSTLVTSRPAPRLPASSSFHYRKGW